MQVCVELEEEKAKHARDMEQGDNVTYMLEKDRERLKQEVSLYPLLCIVTQYAVRKFRCSICHLSYSAIIGGLLKILLYSMY